MDVQNTQPKQRRRHLRLAVSVVLFSALVFLLGLLTFAWQRRVAWATRVVRDALDRQGFSDATFRLVRLSPGCVTLEDLRLGTPEPVLAVDRLEVRFIWPDVTWGRIDSVRVRGVRTPMVVDGRRVVSLLQERLKPLLASKAKPSSVPHGGTRFTVGDLSVYDMRLAVRLAGGAPVTTVTADVGAVLEPAASDFSPQRVSPAGGRVPDQPSDCYRVWGEVRNAGVGRVTVYGTVKPDAGALALTTELKIASVETLLDRVRLVVPEDVVRLPVFPTNCSLSARGSFALSDWTNAGPFEMTAEVGRGSGFAFKQPETWVRFQALRAEASGTPQDVQCRLSAGISGFRGGGQFQASQEEGRMLSVRGTARFRQTATNRWVCASLDSDLPGRSVAQVLPHLLPLVPRLFTDGGTLHLETDISQPLQGRWQGGMRYMAEARRSAVSLPAGRVGAGRAALSGSLAICDARPGDWHADVALEDGFYFGQGLSVRGGCQMSLTARPPYASASGTFKGRISETALMQKCGIELAGGAVSFEGDAEVSGLVSNPVWLVALRVPSFGVGSKPDASNLMWRASAGATADLRYSSTVMAFQGDAWVRDAELACAVSGGVGRVEAGLGQLRVHACLPAFSPAAFSNALSQVTVDASNGWVRAGGRAALEGARVSVPFTWSPAGGVAFLPGQALSWQRLDVCGERLEPDGFDWTSEKDIVRLNTGVRVVGSRFGVTACARIPLADARLTEIAVTLPETELTAEDALAAVVRRVDKDLNVTGRVAAEARVIFLGTHPYATGRVHVWDGGVRRGGLEVGGLAAEVPFESGVSFRTIERPAVTFSYAKAGNVRLDHGRIEFQVTPQEVFVDRMEVGWCKGRLNAYSVHVDPKNPKADVIVYADRIDLGEALMMVMPFKGAMEGVLYGRFPVGIDNGHVKLSTGFLYSLPGQGGKLRLEDHAPMVTLLNRAGIKGEVQQPLSMALSDMDFSAIRMELEPKTGGDAVFRIKLDGKSNYKEWPAPVALNLNLHGPLEQILNVGLDVSRK